MTGPSADSVRKHWQQAQEFLSDAYALFQQSRLKSAVDRAYYAMFHAATAALAMKGVSARSHKALITLFGREFVKTGQIEEEIGSALVEAFEARQESTYEADIVFGAEGVQELLEQAQRFLERVRKVLPKELSSL